jgi:5-methylcytosine-specific restriction endonuclease McrA
MKLSKAAMYKQMKKSIEEIKNDMDYAHCQWCKSSGGTHYQFHHIVYRGEARYHPNLNHRDNLIYICGKCNDKYHGNKPYREQLVKERQLWKLFPEHLRKYNETSE